MAPHHSALSTTARMVRSTADCSSELLPHRLCGYDRVRPLKEIGDAPLLCGKLPPAASHSWHLRVHAAAHASPGTRVCKSTYITPRCRGLCVFASCAGWAACGGLVRESVESHAYARPRRRTQRSRRRQFRAMAVADE